jgi:hypothetical protein
MAKLLLQGVGGSGSQNPFPPHQRLMTFDEPGLLDVDKGAENLLHQRDFPSDQTIQ